MLFGLARAGDFPGRMPVGLHILHSAKEVYRKMVMASIEAILMVVL